MLALCQSETDAGAHWQMVMKLFFLFADQIGRALGMFSKRQERVSIIIILIPFVWIVEKKIPEFSFRVFVHIVLTNKFYLLFFFNFLPVLLQRKGRQ